MAMFGDNPDLVDVQTPDGRTVRVPRAVAMQFPDLAPVPEPLRGVVPYELPAGNHLPQPPPPPPPPKKDDPKKGTTKGTQKIGPVSAIPVEETPARGMGAATTSDLPTADEWAQYRAEEKQRQATPPPQDQPRRPITNADLGKIGPAGVFEAQSAALDDQARAGIAIADAQAKQHEDIGKAYALRNEELDVLFAQRAAEAEAAQREIERKQVDYTAAVDKYANTKIDRSMDRPVLTMISAALTGLGQALAGKQVDVMGMIMNNIDRKVAAQMQALDKQRDVLGMKKEGISMLRERASDRLALQNLAIAGEVERAARYVEEIVARSNSAIVKAQGAEVAAQLRGRKAEALGAAVTRQSDVEFRDKEAQRQDQRAKAQIGLGYAGLRQADRHHGDRMALEREQMALDFQKTVAAAQAAGNKSRVEQLTKLQEENEKRGVGNVATGERLMNAQGKKLLAEASTHATEAQKLFADAAKIEGMGKLDEKQMAHVKALKDKATLLDQKATELRTEANTVHVFRARDATQAGKLSEQYAGAQHTLSLIDDITRLYAQHGKSYFSTTVGQAALQAKATELLMNMKEAWQLGVLSQQDERLINQATGGDPTKWDAGSIAHAMGLDIGKDPEGVIARLDSLAEGLQKKTFNALHAGGYQGNVTDLFKRERPLAQTEVTKATQAILQDKTVTERVEGSEGGVVRKNIIDLPINVVRSVDSAISGDDYASAQDNRTANAENSGHPRYLGLSKQQGDRVGELLQAYRNGNAQAGEQLVELAKSGRESLGIAIMQNLKREAPDLAQRALPQLKGAVAEQMKYEAPMERRPDADTKELVSLAKRAVVDHAAYAELERRAATGDPQAKSLFSGVNQHLDRRGRR